MGCRKWIYMLAVSVSVIYSAGAVSDDALSSGASSFGNKNENGGGTPVTEVVGLPIQTMITPDSPYRDLSAAQDDRYWFCPYVQNYAGPAAFFWRIPYQTYGITKYAMRFTACETETLLSADIMIYDAGGGTFGNDDLVISVHTDDGFGYPGAQLAARTIPAGSYPSYPNQLSVDFSPDHLTFVDGENFYVACSTNAAPGEFEACLSDDGYMGTGRSYIFLNGYWSRTVDFGRDYNFLIAVTMCRDCPIPDERSVAANGVSSPVMSGSFRTDMPGPMPQGMDYRVLVLDRAWFKHTGDRVGRADAYAFGTAGPQANFPNKVESWTKPPKDGKPIKINRARRNGKNKCEDFSCGMNNDKCNWEPIGVEVYHEWAMAGNFAGPNVEVKTEFDDYDRPIGPYLKAIGVGTLTLLTCIGAFTTYGFAADQCAKMAVFAVEAFAGLFGVKYSQNGTIIGKHTDLMQWPSPSCNNFELHETVDGWGARIEYRWGSSKKATNLQGNCYPAGWPGEQGPTGSIDELAKFCYSQVDGSQLEFWAYSKGASLRDTCPYGAPCDDFTREFQFAINSDNSDNTGDPSWPLCGADYYVSVYQTIRNVEVQPGIWEKRLMADTAIYKWDSDCCTGLSWILVTDAKPYDLAVGHFKVEIVVAMDKVGDPQEAISSWAVMKVDGEVVSLMPEYPCTERIQITRQPDQMCPRVKESYHDGEADKFVLVFSEPMSPIQLSDIILTPPVTCSLSTDTTLRELYVWPIPKFVPGYYELQLLPVTDRAVPGNPLDGNFDGTCGDSYFTHFCVEEGRFYADGDFDPDSGVYYDDGDIIYVSGEGFAPEAPFYVYLVQPTDVEVEGTKLFDLTYDGPNLIAPGGDGSIVMGDKDRVLIDQTNDGPNLITPGSDGSIVMASIGRAVAPGEYSIVGDINGDGKFQFTDQATGYCDPALLYGDPDTLTVEICGVNDLIAWWPLNEDTAAGGAADLAWGNHGIYAGDPAPATGVFGPALYFDGLDDCIYVPHNEILNIDPADSAEWGDFSVKAWINTSDVSGVATIVDKTGGAESGFRLHLQNGFLGFHLGDGTGSGNWLSGAFVADGQWHEVSALVDRDAVGGMKLYVDDSLVLQGDARPYGDYISSDSSLRIGAGGAFGDFFHGSIDNVVICGGVAVGSCCDNAGDANNDGAVNLADAVFLINYVFKGGPPPTCLAEGDANGDGACNLADAVYLINYVFKGGPAPICGP